MNFVQMQNGKKVKRMRLIDGDALEDRLQSLAYDDWNQGVITSWADAYRECADMVYEQPTIEPERKKGKWIDITKDGGCFLYKCSECSDLFLEDYNFCPNCGADMRGEAE